MGYCDYGICLKKAWFMVSSKMSLFNAWLYSCTNTIILHFFTQIVGYECLKDIFMVKDLICDSQAQRKDPYVQWFPMSSLSKI